MFADRGAHQTLGIVHEILARPLDRSAAVAAHKIDVTLRADLRGGDLRLHIADDEI